MNLFYNKDGIGDTLMINYKSLSGIDWEIEQFGDVVRIADSSSKEVLGYNIFRASTYGTIAGEGAIEGSEEVKTLIEQAFTKNGVKDEIHVEKRTPFVVGQIVEKKKHPNADKLSVCQVDIGSETLQIVCGAPNVEEGQRVVVALIGAVMPSGLVIEQSTLRGVDSFGMICSAKELALPNAPEERGILVLDSSYEVGSEFRRN